MPPQGEYPKDRKSTLSQNKVEALSPQFSELKTCSIKVSINLNNFSNNFSPPVLKALEESSGLQKIEKDIKFFIPHNFRTLQDAIDSCEKIGELSSELEDWCEDYFGHLLVTGYKEKLVQHGISLIFWLCPFHPVDSPQFKILCHFIIVAAIGDDWMDGAAKPDKKDAENGRDEENKGYQNRLEFVKFLNNMVDQGDEEIQGLGAMMAQPKTSMTEIMMKEPIIAAFYDSLTFVQELIKELQPNGAKNTSNMFGPFKKTLITGLQSFQWRYDTTGRNVVDDYSTETCRYFRQIEGILEGFIPMVGLIEDLDLPSNIRNHTVFMKWRDVAGKMDAIQNDVLGLQKDLQIGEEDGIVMQKIRKGLTVVESVNEEMDLLSELSSDYVNLRRVILLQFQDAKFQRYVNIVDTVLYANFQTYVGSNKYGMRGQIEIVHD